MGKQRIMVVDDDPGIRDVLRLSLKAAGCEVQTVENGKQCLETVTKYNPDVVILDVMMPGMNGDKVAKKLRKNAETSNIPIIMLTGLNDSKYIKAALFDLGVKFYITKPFEIADLIDKVADSIRYRTPD
jgi:DNA-binding response OmpR family regulator